MQYEILGSIKKYLEIVTNRENCNRKHLKSSSKYTGVHWCKRDKKWVGQITINGKLKHLGYFINEYDAHLAYQKELKYINKNTNYPLNTKI